MTGAFFGYFGQLFRRFHNRLVEQSTIGDGFFRKMFEELPVGLRLLHQRVQLQFRQKLPIGYFLLENRFHCLGLVHEDFDALYG